MHLSPKDTAEIHGSTAKVAGPNARVMLFGSRTRANLRGGDIDRVPRAGSRQTVCFIAHRRRAARREGIALTKGHLAMPLLVASAQSIAAEVLADSGGEDAADRGKS
jgi:hypothetical protein